MIGNTTLPQARFGPEGGPARTCFAVDALPPRAAFPDLEHQLGLILVAGDQAVVTFAAYGTNQATFRGRPAGNQVIGLLGAQHLRLAGGVVQDADFYVDPQSMLGQLGQLPSGATYRAAAQKGSQGQTRTAVGRDDGAEKANLALVARVEAALSTSAIADAVTAFAPEGRFVYVPGPVDAAGPANLTRQLTAWRARLTMPAVVEWTLAAGEHVAVGIQPGGGAAPELHLYRLAGGTIADLWIYGTRPPATAPAPAPPAPRPPAR